ncbi:MAG: hypothetical protein AAF203_11335, partial [Pseudomonadota bacterium]
MNMKHMKIVGLAILILGLMGAQAQAKDFKLECHTAMLTTSLIIESKGPQATVNMINFNGTQYMPIHEGLVTPNDLPLLQKQANVLQSLPENMEMVTESKNCEWMDGFKGQCFGRGPQQLGAMTSDGFHIMVMEKQTTILDYSPFRSVFARLRLRIDGKSYALPM